VFAESATVGTRGGVEVESMSSSPATLPWTKTGTTISDLVSREQAR
jgi:hypothetical protein